MTPSSTKARARERLRRRWRELRWHGDDPVGQALARGLTCNPSGQFIYADEVGVRALRALDVAEKAQRMSTALYRNGFRPGDRLLVQLPHCPENTITVCAAMQLGLVLVPVVHIYGPAELTFIATDSKAKGYVSPARFRRLNWPERIEAIGRVPSMEHIVVVDHDEHESHGATCWDDFLDRGSSGDVPVSAVDPDSRCLICYTSGTTAEPKGAVHTHNTLLAEVRSWESVTPSRAAGPYLQAQPAGHIAGLSGWLRSAIAGSGLTLHLDSWNAVRGARLIEEYRAVVSTGPPFYLATLVAAAREEAIDVSSMTAYRTGGVTQTLVQLAEEASIRAHRCYGSTEHPSVTSCFPWDPFDVRSSRDGRPLPGSEVRIVDADGGVLPARSEGEIIAIGPDQFVGYTNPILDEESFRDDGWFRTGDVGYLDREGYLSVTDRLKDIVRRGGENISSLEVENILLRHPAVREAALIGLPDARYGERPVAVVILEEDETLSLDDVRDHFQAHGVARQKTPEKLELVEDFPRTVVGRVRKDVLRRTISPPSEWSSYG